MAAMAVINRLNTLIRKNGIGKYCSAIKIGSDLDLEYLCDGRNLEEIKENVRRRKGVGDISKVIRLRGEAESLQGKGDAEGARRLLKEMEREAGKIPNRTHPEATALGEEPKLIKFINERPDDTAPAPAYDFAEIARKLNVMRTDQLGPIAGHRSYFFMDELARLEEALIRHTVADLLARGFALVSVPDILPRSTIEGCGMTVEGDRTQIYSLDATHHNPELRLSGTAEMSLAGLLTNTHRKEKDLPVKLAAVSRCYRAEASGVAEERGIYRVHQFTKVEMFGVTTPNRSDETLEEFRKIEEENFSKLGLHMRVLEMPPHELGAPAYRKYDIEAWMPGRKMFGEISSCSNCTDYQSRRLKIKYTCEKTASEEYAHTLNGTACAVPRMLIALIETHQRSDGKIYIPEPLRKYMGGEEFICRSRRVPFLKLAKLK